MPRLHYYAIGGGIVAVIYGGLYSRLYVPYTTHQREMELVLEAEKFVSQQLLQRAERLLRQVAVAPQAQLPTIMAATYLLHQDFESADLQTALPRSLYISRLNNIRERCTELPGRGALSRGESFRCALCYVLFVFFYRMMNVVSVQRVVSPLLLWLLRIDPVVVMSSDDDTSRASSPGSSSGERGGDKSESGGSGGGGGVGVLRTEERVFRRADEIVARGGGPKDEVNEHNTDNNQQSSKHVVVSVAHVSHWIEELIVRAALLQSPSSSSWQESDKVVIRYPASATSTAASTGGSTNNKAMLSTDYVGVGYPWFDPTVVSNDNSTTSTTPLLTDRLGDGRNPGAASGLFVRPVVVTGMEKILNMTPPAASSAESSTSGDAATEAALALAAAGSGGTGGREASSSPSSSSSLDAKPSEEDLLKRRRVLVDTTRVKDESEAAKRQREIAATLYGGGGGGGGGGGEGGGGEGAGSATATTQTSTSAADDAVENNRTAEQQTASASASKVQQHRNSNSNGRVAPPRQAGTFDGAGDADHGSRVGVHVGSPCIPQELWRTTLRDLVPASSAFSVLDSED